MKVKSLNTLFWLNKKGIRIYCRLLQLTHQYWKAFLLGVLGTIMLSAIDALFAWFLEPIINKGFVARDVYFVHWLPLLVLVLALLRGVSGFASSYYIVRVSRHIVMDFRQKIFAHLMQLPIEFYDQHTSGHLLSSIIYNVEQVAQASSDALLIILRESTLTLGLIVVMFVINWQLSLLFCVVVPLIGWAVKISGDRMRRLSKSVQETIGDVTHIAEEGIENHRVIRIYGGECYECKKFNQATLNNRQRELKVAATNSLSTAMVQLIIALPLALILWFATMPSLHISAGSFAAITAALIQILRPIRRLTLVNSYIQKGIAAAGSIFELLDKKTESCCGDYKVRRVEGRVGFDNVSFAYRTSQTTVLHNISFDLAPGQTLALVGLSGAGKSTLIHLMPRFYDITQGVITVDGVDIRRYDLNDLRQQFALVSQDSTLFNDTIAHNIAYGAVDAKAKKADIIKAAQAAHAMEFIQELPKGLETMVGENGVLLSGGQRQRLAIARALLKNAPILILDEATSSLDSQSEQSIQEALKQLMHQSTTLVIAHRLSTIEHADKILVMESGRVVEQGTHQMLIAEQGLYAKLHQIQLGSGRK